MLRRVVPLETLAQTTRLFRSKFIVQKVHLVGAQIVTHQHDLFRIGIDFIRKAPKHIRYIYARVLFPYAYLTRTGEGFLPQE